MWMAHVRSFAGRRGGSGADMMFQGGSALEPVPSTLCHCLAPTASGFVLMLIPCGFGIMTAQPQWP